LGADRLGGRGEKTLRGQGRRKKGWDSEKSSVKRGAGGESNASKNTELEEQEEQGKKHWEKTALCHLGAGWAAHRAIKSKVSTKGGRGFRAKRRRNGKGKLSTGHRYPNRGVS